MFNFELGSVRKFAPYLLMFTCLLGWNASAEIPEQEPFLLEVRKELQSLDKYRVDIREYREQGEKRVLAAKGSMLVANPHWIQVEASNGLSAFASDGKRTTAKVVSEFGVAYEAVDQELLSRLSPSRALSLAKPNYHASELASLQPLDDDYDTTFLRLLELYDYREVQRTERSISYLGELNLEALAHQRKQLFLPQHGLYLKGPFPPQSHLLVDRASKLPVELSYQDSSKVRYIFDNLVRVESFPHQTWEVTLPQHANFRDLTGEAAKNLLEFEGLAAEDPLRSQILAYFERHPTELHPDLKQHLLHYRFAEAVEFLRSHPEYRELEHDSRPILHFFVKRAEAKDLRALIRVIGKENINKRDSIGYPPLMSAIIARRYDNVRVLLESGADLNVASSDGDLPMDSTDDARMKALLRSFLQDPGESPVLRTNNL